MNSPRHRLPTAEEALASFGRGDPAAIQTCFQVFATLLFALAEQAQIADQEKAVEAVLRDLETYHLGWPRSGLAARVWVVGIAQRRLRLLSQNPSSVAA